MGNPITSPAVSRAISPKTSKRTVRLRNLKDGLLLVLSEKAKAEPDVLRWWGDALDLLLKHPKGMEMFLEVSRAKNLPCQDIIRLHLYLAETKFTYH